MRVTEGKSGSGADNRRSRLGMAKDLGRQRWSLANCSQGWLRSTIDVFTFSDGVLA